MSVFLAQLKSEVRLVLRNGEQLLLTLGIPVMLLIFFSLVDVLPTGESDPINFLAPGVL
jgi:ABC-2 type transport system permease protein